MDYPGPLLYHLDINGTLSHSLFSPQISISLEVKFFDMFSSEPAQRVENSHFLFVLVWYILRSMEKIQNLIIHSELLKCFGFPSILILFLNINSKFSSFAGNIFNCSSFCFVDIFLTSYLQNSASKICNYHAQSY